MRLDARTLGAFFAIYVIWGSTYLAIRVAVETMPPLATAGVRQLFAGIVLFVWARAWRTRITAAEWRGSLVVGTLFFLVGHGTLHWAEQMVPSGIAALLVATEPAWIAILMPSDGRSRWNARTVTGLATGLAGVGVLVDPGAFTAGSAQLWGSGAILIGALSWAIGVRHSATATLPADPFVRAATTLLCGAALLLVASAATGEPARIDRDAISGASIVALAYLVLGGSVVAFSAYTWLLERCSATLVATHTYVNPLVAVTLGWLFAGEPLTGRVALATGLIVSAVLLLRTESRSEEHGDVAPAGREPVRATVSE